MHVRFALLCLVFTASVSAQTIIIGPNATPPNGGTVAGSYTFVDLTTPATAYGTITSAHFDWAATCTSNTAKIKFFHRSGNTLTFFAERGPFNTLPNADVTVTLTPPVSVQPGDVIGITDLGIGCGNATVRAGTGASAGYVYFTGDVSGTVTTSSGTVIPNTLLTLGGSGVGIGNVPALGASALALLALTLVIAAFVVLRSNG